MNEKHYNIQELSKILEISTTSVCELRKKLKLEIVDDANLRIMQYTTNKIRKAMKYVTTSTINMYFIQEEKERQYELARKIRATEEAE